MAYIIIVSAFGIAWVCDMERNNYFSYWEQQYNEFYYDTLVPLSNFKIDEIAEEFKSI